MTRQNCSFHRLLAVLPIMDGFSTAIGLLSGIAAIIKATTELYSLIDSIVDAPGFLTDLKSQLQTLGIVLSEIDRTSNQQNTSEALKVSLDKCKELLDAIGILLKPLRREDKDGSVRAKWKQIRTAFKEDEIKSAMNGLESFKITLVLAW
ncbi:hypothetical protein K440DRAFT_38346 [Wilcoxina mikolae CBS 423.85]|nr:hypothetical protein K440DRAFT_38346 [Wilcoxina mikolae CBS 423.85]